MYYNDYQNTTIIWRIWLLGSNKAVATKTSGGFLKTATLQNTKLPNSKSGIQSCTMQNQEYNDYQNTKLHNTKSGIQYMIIKIQSCTIQNQET